LAKSDAEEVGPRDPKKKSSPVGGPGPVGRGCTWNDKYYNEGEKIKMNGRSYKCTDGVWVLDDT
jgi:hypothetical protein